MFSEYVLDLLEAERKFLLFAHHQEMLDAIEDAVKAVSVFIDCLFCFLIDKICWIYISFLYYTLDKMFVI